MGAVIVVVALLGAAATAVTYLMLSRKVRAAGLELQMSQSEARDVTQRLAALDAERESLQQELEAQRRGRRATEAELTAARDSLAANQQARREADGCWALLLADVERRWAAGVGASSDSRGVLLAGMPEQLNEALIREVERLREEVGVDITVDVGETIEPDDAVVFLLAATHVMGILAAGCQQVRVALDGALEISGDDWSGSMDELESARDRALAAGAQIGALEIETQERATEDDDPDDSEPLVSVQLAIHP